jgi:hypothetical protein
LLLAAIVVFAGMLLLTTFHPEETWNNDHSLLYR